LTKQFFGHVGKKTNGSNHKFNRSQGKKRL
jgi:hypothetical protein